MPIKWLSSFLKDKKLLNKKLQYLLTLRTDYIKIRNGKTSYKYIVAQYSWWREYCDHRVQEFLAIHGKPAVLLLSSFPARAAVETGWCEWPDAQ